MLKRPIIAFVLLLITGTSFAADPTTKVDARRLAAVFRTQPDDVKARYPYRHPQETLEFFGIAPGVGVEQHQAPDNLSDDWASGRSGYLKKQFIVSPTSR